AGFEFVQITAGSLDYVRLYAGEARYFQTIALSCRAFAHAVEESEAAGVFAGLDVGVGDAGELLGKVGQLEIVGGEKRQCAARGKRFGDGAGERDAVVGAGAASDFIHDDETFGGSRVEDARRLDHFHHEGRAPAGEIVGRADARGDAIHRADHGAAGGHETADVGQEHDQRRLAHVGGFA